MALSRKPQEIVEDSTNPLLGKHESWARIPVGKIADILNGFAFKSSKFNKEKGIPLIRIRDVGKNSSDTYYEGEYDETYIVQDGDLLIGMDGDFRAAIWKGGKALLNQRVCKISLKSNDYDFKFLSYAIQPYLDAIHAETSAVTVKHLSSNSISEIPLPLPPLAQQKRIVAKIEELFSHIDAGIDALKKAKQLLKQYRQSVLKAAVTGELTKEWRKANKDKLEPASKLLERILKERRQKWEKHQLEEFKAKGKVPKDGKWREKYKEPEYVASSDVLLPAGWKICTLEQLITELKNGISIKPTEDSGLAILRISAVRPMSVNKEDVRFLPDDFDSAGYEVEDGDLLFTRYNGNPELVGVCGKVRALQQKTVYPDKLMRARVVNDSLISSDYLEISLNCGISKEFIRSLTKTTAGQSGIAGSDVKKCPIALPCLEEQKEISKRVSEKISAINHLEDELGVKLIKAEKNKKSILASAFYGSLIGNN